MKKSKSQHAIGMILALLLLTSCAGIKPAAPGRLISAADQSFRYEGRFDLSDPAAPVVIWEGSRISFDCDGPELALRFAGAKGQNFFDVRVDEVNSILGVAKGKSTLVVPLPAPPSQRHRVVLFKRSEASAGTVRFTGVTVSTGARLWPSAPADYRLAMGFFGDSKTAAACDEDGAVDQWDDRRTHNSALSYATLTAAHFSADHQNISVSGMGVVTGWTNVLARQIWDRLYPKVGSAPADLTQWQPEIIFVNLGDNDESFSRSRHKPFPPAFADAYVSLVRGIRGAYPKARIVLLRGGMTDSSQKSALRDAWEAAVARLEKTDAAISHFVFTHWSSNHPRVADHRILADELIGWLEKQGFPTSR